MTKALASLISSTSIGAGLLFGAATMAAQAHADDPCRAVCITDIHPAGANLHVTWAGDDRFAYYEVYAERTGTVDIRTEKLGPEQFAYDVTNVVPGATYKIQVLGCTASTPGTTTARADQWIKESSPSSPPAKLATRTGHVRGSSVTAVRQWHGRLLLQSVGRDPRSAVRQ